MFNSYATSESNISFKSVTGIMIKTHPKSKISYMHRKSNLYETIKKEQILQFMLISDEWFVLEWLENIEDMKEIFEKKVSTEK